MSKSTCNLFFTAFLLIISLSNCTKEVIIIDDGNGQNSTPNIIFILADDLGWDVFGNYAGINGLKAKTPTLDSLANQGITFTNCWVNPICAPTRASILTGKYAFRTGVGGVQTPPTDVLQSSETIIQKYINDKTSNAYATAIIGKWHVSKNNQLNEPENFGVSYYSGIYAGAVPDYYNWTETSGGIQKNVTTYTSTHFVNQSVNWIQNQSKPFFLWLAFNAPHTPFHRPPLELISDKTLSNNQSEIDANPFSYYLASIEAMDSEIARLIHSLTPAQKENTVFIFLGDNGTPTQVGQDPYAMNGTKNTLFQGGINTPLIISGKNVSRKNATESAMVQSTDFFATFADIAGAGSSNYEDAVSMKPFFTDANATKRTFVYTEQFGNTTSLMDGYAIRNEKYKLIHLDNGKEYFYDLSADEFEKENLFAFTLSIDAQENLKQLRDIKSTL